MSEDCSNLASLDAFYESGCAIHRIHRHRHFRKWRSSSTASTSNLRNRTSGNGCCIFTVPSFSILFPLIQKYPTAMQYLHCGVEQEVSIPDHNRTPFPGAFEHRTLPIGLDNFEYLLDQLFTDLVRTIFTRSQSTSNSPYLSTTIFARKAIIIVARASDDMHTSYFSEML